MSALPGQAATPGDAPRASPPRIFGDAFGNAGKSFLDHVAAPHVEEQSHPPPATSQPAIPRREPEPWSLLFASLGLLAYLGLRRKKALAATY